MKNLALAAVVLGSLISPEDAHAFRCISDSFGEVRSELEAVRSDKDPNSALLIGTFRKRGWIYTKIEAYEWEGDTYTDQVRQRDLWFSGEIFNKQDIEQASIPVILYESTFSTNSLEKVPFGTNMAIANWNEDDAIWKIKIPACNSAFTAVANPVRDALLERLYHYTKIGAAIFTGGLFLVFATALARKRRRS